MRVSYRDCTDQLIRTEAAENDLRKWLNRSYVYKAQGFPNLARQQDEFRDRVKAFVHSRLFQIRTWEVMETLRRTKHALGELEKVADERELTEEAPWPFSFSYYLHTLLERKDEVPRWQDLWHAVWHGEFRPYFRDCMTEALRMAAAKLHTSVDLTEEEMERSAQWRLGKYYYSAVREIYLYAALRERFDIHLRYHLFADVRLFVDGWTESGALLCLRLRNWRENRKGQPEEWIPPGYRVVRAAAAFGKRGRAWLPSDDQIAQVGELLRSGTRQAPVPPTPAP